MLVNNEITRRQALGAVGAMGVSLLGTKALAQKTGDPPKLMAAEDFHPKLITANSHLAKAAVLAAGTFKMGDKTVALKLDTAKPHAIVKDFDLPADAARKLGRKENIVECTSCAISDKDSIDAIHSRLSQLKVPKEIREQSAYYFLRGGHRTSDNKKEAMALAKVLPIQDEKLLILGIMEGRDKKTVLTVLRNGRRGAFVIKGAVPSKDAPTTTAPPPKTDVHPDDTGDKAGACFAGCSVLLVPAMLPVMAILCPPCIASFAAEPISFPLTLLACAICVTPIGAAIVSCLIICELQQ